MKLFTKRTLKSRKFQVFAGIALAIILVVVFALVRYNQWNKQIVYLNRNSGTATSKPFTVKGPWEIVWSYDCDTNKPGTFAVVVNNSNNQAAADTADVYETGTQGYGVTDESQTGTFRLVAVSQSCGYAVGVKAHFIVKTYAHNQGGGSSTSTTPTQPKVLLDLSGNGDQQTQPFSTTGNWTLIYIYDCSAFGSQGNFQVGINNTDGSTNTDTSPNELGTSGGNTDYYYDPGQHYLSINSECAWHITVKG